MEPTVLVVNPGSSSREYALYVKGEIQISAYYEHKGEKCALTVSIGGVDTATDLEINVFSNALQHFLEICREKSLDPAGIDAVGIRTVSPGRSFLKPHKLDAELHDYLKNNVERAPLHIRIELDQIDQVQKYLSRIPIYLISDSEFHKTLSHEARNYAIRKSDADKYDIYRFGYHGISVKSVVHVLREELSLNYSRIIVCHLGSGSSITAVRNWESIETSMGYSPLEGLIMSTRSGNIDTEAAIEIKRKLKLDDHQLVYYLNNKSGLQGLSEISNDIRQLLASEESGNDNAKFALDSMVYRIQSYIGAYVAVLGGLDAIVFTATVGERSAVLRQRICDSVKHLCIKIDDTKNRNTDSEQALISEDSSLVAIHVVPSNEPAEIARQTVQLICS